MAKADKVENKDQKVEKSSKKSNKSCDNTEVNVIFFILFGLVYACIGSRLK